MNIKIVYFTYLVPNKWEPIVLEQLEALYNITSLYEKASIYISLTDESESQHEFKKLRNIISSKYNKIQFINVFSKNVYEYPGLKSVYEVSTDNDSEYILYFHSKGMTSNQDLERGILFNYTIQNYQKYLDEMENNKEIDIASLIPCVKGFGYYNFFWARSSYINKYCSKPEYSPSYIQHERYTWEIWIGNNYSRKNFIKTYSPYFKYNGVEQHLQAMYLMNLFKNNQFDTIEKLSNPHVFYSIMKLHRIKIKDFIDNKLTDKNTLHSYVNVYEDMFDSLRYTAKNILEIGMAPGGSIMVWRNYFINAHIYGIDTCNLANIHSQSIKNDYHITLFPNTNGYNDQFIKENFTNKNIKFDMVLDDASHTLEDIIYFIMNYLPLLSDNGIMVIENIQKMEWIEILKLIVPDEFKKNIQIYDLRHIKNRYDDVLFVVNKNSFIQLNY
jgi:hypothetical protein